ncbi:universal stress protein [Mycobacterium sp.]|uniref:universal stress protein n=1 Tax=Mycobacterium sp. TaxID=1785 RepID=UPI003F9DF34C
MEMSSKHYGIIVGVDGSPASDAAVGWAAHDAVMRGVPLTLIHVQDPATRTWSQAKVLEEVAGWQKAEGGGILANASKIAHDIANETSQITINGELLFSAPGPALVDRSEGAELIVVGTDGRGALTRGLLGSVSSGLVRHAGCPVAVIREGETQMPHPANAPVLVGVDGSSASELATEIAFDEASRRHVGLIALHAWSNKELVDVPGVNWPAVKADEERLMSEALAGWQERYPDVTVNKLLVCDKPARAIVETSQSAQLVVLGSHGRNALTRTFLGSVSNAVVQSVRVPVIVARPE